jgi:hypothetical protein
MSRGDKFIMSNNSISKQFNYVDFDPKNKHHRAAFVEFKLSGKWPTSIRFNLDPLYNNVPSMINQKLLEFYFNRDRAIPQELKERYNQQDAIYPIGSTIPDDQVFGI